uniref:Uncharacterized protein n=1 Tax=Arundo donax TaxID=35708 RepID=A0A0A8YRV3_ARUDO
MNSTSKKSVFSLPVIWLPRFWVFLQAENKLLPVLRILKLRLWLKIIRLNIE